MTRFRALGSFLGARCLGLFAVGQVFALLLAGVEYCIAIFLIVFLYSVKLVDISQIPSWLPLKGVTLSSTFVWGAFLLVAVLQAGFQIVVYQSKIMLTEGAHARMRTVLGYLMLRPARPAQVSLSEANHLTAEVFPKATSFIFYFTQLFSFLTKALAMSVMMFLLAAEETLIGIGGLAVMVCAVLLLNRVTNRVSAEVPPAQERLERSKVRITGNWLLIRILRMEKRELAAYLDSVASYYRHSVSAYFFGNLGGAVMPVFGIILIATIALTSLSVFHTPAAALVAFLYLFLRFEQMVANGSNLIGGLFSYRHHLDKLVSLISSLSRRQLEGALSPASRSSTDQAATRSVETEKAPTPPAIEFREVAFAWETGGPPVFSGISHSVAPGCQLAIVGPNGCGKSTLLCVVLGALQPCAGEVLIGDTKAADWVNRHADSVAFVGSLPYLVYGSIRQNLTYGLREKCSDEDLWRAIDDVGLAEFVQGVPEGLEYPIQENGDGLSTGQKQRISIARAFLRRPRLLVLDEPFANLDEASAREIADRLRSMKHSCTVLLVSHDPEMLVAADSRLDLDPYRSRVGV